MGRRLISVFILVLLFVLTSCEDLALQLEKSILKSNEIYGNLVTVATETGGTILEPQPVSSRIEDGITTNIEVSTASGYTFDGWSQTSGKGSVEIANASSSATEIIVTGGDATITAAMIAATYTLTVTVNNVDYGSISNPASGTATVTHGVARSISASDPTLPGMYFSGWTVVSGTADFANASSKSTTVTVTGGNASIRANYAPIVATLNYVSTYGLNSSAYTSERLTTPKDIIVVGNYAYVGGISPAGGAQILKIDISNKSIPSHYDNRSIGTGAVNDMQMFGTTMSVAVSSGNTSIADLYTFTPTSNFSLTDSSYNNSVYLTGGNNYFMGSSNSLEYIQSHASWNDVDISSITWDSNYNRAYVTGYFDYGSGELHTLRHNGSTEEFDDVVPPFVIESYNGSWDYYFYDVLVNDIYLYIAMDVGGILTMFIDDNPLTVEDREPRSTASGNPRFLEFGGSNNNYLVSLSFEYSSTNDGRLAVYDIHSNNGSQSEPTIVGNRETVYTTQPIALATSGNYVYTIEGTNMVIYELVTNTD